VWRNVIVFFHNIIIFVLVCIYAGVAVTWTTLLFVPGFALACFNAVWIAILLAAVCARYRDAVPLVGTILQISLFITPIFWSEDQLTGRTAALAQYNPLYHFIAVVREPLLGKSPERVHWVVVALITVIGWLLAVRTLSKIRHRIVYWI
jgi:ABC-type polysaccharide/polyol phosphate export permease